MNTSETQADYSLDISIVRELSPDGTAHSKRSHKFRNLRATALTIDFPSGFRVEDPHAQIDNFARTSAGDDLPILTSSDGVWIRNFVQPNVTIQPGETWSIEFEYTNSGKANYVKSLDTWMCHESWRLGGSPPDTGLKESRPRSYHYSARVLDGRFKVLGWPVSFETLVASGYPERQVVSARGYQELTWNFNLQEGRSFHLTVIFAQRPMKYRNWVIVTGAPLVAAAITAATGAEISSPF